MHITTRHDIAEWWALVRDGATPLVDDEDADFIAEAMALLPEGPPRNPTRGSPRRML